MRQSNKILVGCLALLLVLSVGYALFSDTITINGTATAKGEFELTTTSADFSESWFEDYLGRPSTRGIVENSTIIVKDNTVNTSVTLGMPGSDIIFVVKVINTGTIPAKLKNIENATTGELILSESDYGSNVNCIGDVYESRICAELHPDSGWYDDYESDITNGERWMDSMLDPMMLDAVLDPGEEAYYFFWYTWGSNSTVQGEPVELNWSVKLNWEQVTN